MSWVADTLPNFKAWFGGTPAPSDSELTRALTVALAIVETYLDRPLELAERVQEDAPTRGVVLLRAWPVDSIASITAEGAALELGYVKLEKSTGRLFIPGCYYMATLTTYTGGYAPFPADLELALWMVAAGIFPTVQSAAGAPDGPPEVRVSTPDVGTIEYARSAGGDGDALLGATLSPIVEAMLLAYRNQSTVGGA